MAVDVTQPTAQDPLSLQELDLYHAITAYRESLGLAAAPLSRALTTTAGRHVADTRENIWAEGLELPEDANLHSWSDAFYFDDNRDPEVMWEAPRRVGTDYASAGYEISAAGFATVEEALEGWIGSESHNAVLANLGVWEDVEFLAMGVGVDTSPGAGIYGGRIFHVWFGEAADAEIPEIHGTADGDEVEGTAFDDDVRTLAGDDAVRGGEGDDALRGGGGEDRLLGEAGEDALHGGNDDDRLYGGSGEDRASGQDGDDRLWGGSAGDRLSGGEGDDALTGSGGRDLLYGGADGDVFVYGALGDSRAGAASRDAIADFEVGRDLIDLSAIDADAGTDRDDAFRFVSDREFGSAPGRLRQEKSILEGDVDGDGAADFQIRLRATTTLVELPSGGPNDPVELAEVTATPVLSASDFVL